VSFSCTTHKIIQKISDVLQTENRKIFPDLDNVWRAMLLTPLKDLRCVILGQDPYHSLYGDSSVEDRVPACGVSFHVKPGHNVNPSMKNILTELRTNGYAADPESGDLSKWTQHGVLLLNTALTVAQGEPESHIGLWREFTTAFIDWIGERVPAMLWGKKAIEHKGSFVDSVCTKHPSPLAGASAKSGGQYPAFQNSLCFKKMNELLKKLGKPEIKWELVART
jgi:uracil-DNA glycosylase